jgi:Fe-S cluster biogenesis protein NfuA
MLLLHGLHPDDLETRVRRAVDRLRPHLGVHGLRLDVVEIVSGTVRLRVHGSGAATIKAPLLWTLPGEIEDAVVEAAPDVEKVLIDGLDCLGVAAAVRAAE